jgi:Uma2 family endonuclease
MTEPARKRPTYDDIVALPDGVTGEILDGELVVSPRPSQPHALASSNILIDVGQAFGRGGGGRGPGGWWVLIEPELHLGGHVLVPDLAAWRRERLPTLTQAVGVTVVPDWVCEVVSPSTARRDRVRKMPLYASLGVAHLWLVDPLARVVESYHLEQNAWVVAGTWGGAETARVPPFHEIDLDLGAWWLPEEDPSEGP